MIAHALLSLVVSSNVVVDRGDYRIHAATLGEGRPMVAIAGGPGFSGQAVWGIGFGARLACKTYLFDQLGTGQSLMKDAAKPVEATIDLFRTVDDLEALRRATGHKKWIVFGQSWGVIVALVYAATHPGAVEHLVLASVPGLGSNGHVLGTNLSKAMPAEVVQRLVEMGADPSLSENEQTLRAVLTAVPYYFHDPEFGARLAAKAPAKMFSPTVFNALRRHILVTEAYRGALDRLKGTKLPVTMIQGHQDPCGAAMPYLLRDAWLPRAKVRMIDRVGHFSWIEDRESFFHVFHDALKLPVPPYLQSDNVLDNPEGDKELKEMEKHGWPFGVVSPDTGTRSGSG